MREVFEETSIKTEFISIVAVRHFQPRKRYMGKFSCSDVYFVAHLKPVDGTEIKICPRELSAACWMPVSWSWYFSVILFNCKFCLLCSWRNLRLILWHLLKIRSTQSSFWQLAGPMGFLYQLTVFLQPID